MKAAVRHALRRPWDAVRRSRFEREMRGKLDALELDIDQRIDRSRTELAIALDFITLRNLRDAYELHAAAARRAAVDRAREDR